MKPKRETLATLSKRVVALESKDHRYENMRDDISRELKGHINNEFILLGHRLETFVNQCKAETAKGRSEWNLKSGQMRDALVEMLRKLP